MKKIKTFKVCHECDGKGEIIIYFSKNPIKLRQCNKCNGKGYLK